MSFKVRSAEQGDFEQVTALLSRLHLHQGTVTSADDPLTAKTADIFISETLSGGGHLFVAEDPQGRLMGFANISFFEGRKTTEVTDLYVLPEHEGKYISLNLGRACEAMARTRGYEALDLCVLETNPAMRLYQRFGFAVLPETDLVGPRQPGKTYIQIMRKDLV